MKMNFLLSGAVFLSLLALSCPWRAAAASEKEEKKLLLPAQAIDTDCAGFIKRNKISGSSDCAVSETRTFGSVDGQAYDYALYMLDNGMHRGLSIFTRNATDKKSKLLLERYDKEGLAYIYGTPAIIRNSFGTLLDVSVRADGTGSFNESEYYLWSEKQKGWNLLDSTSWLDDLGKRLPAGLEIWKGVWPDMKTMTATTGLWREDDANCCPSGGTAAVALAVKDGRLVIKSLEISKGEGN